MSNHLQDNGKDFTEIKLTFSQMLKVADKYLSAVKFTAGLIAQVANLGEQLQAVEVVSSSSHVIHVKHPDVAVKLSSCIQGNIMTLATDIQSKMYVDLIVFKLPSRTYK